MDKALKGTVHPKTICIPSFPPATHKSRKCQFHSTTSQWLSSYTKDNHCGPNETCTKSQVFFQRLKFKSSSNNLPLHQILQLFNIYVQVKGMLHLNSVWNTLQADLIPYCAIYQSKMASRTKKNATSFCTCEWQVVGGKGLLSRPRTRQRKVKKLQGCIHLKIK